MQLTAHTGILDRTNLLFHTIYLFVTPPPTPTTIAKRKQEQQQQQPATMMTLRYIQSMYNRSLCIALSMFINEAYVLRQSVQHLSVKPSFGSMCVCALLRCRSNSAIKTDINVNDVESSGGNIARVLYPAYIRSIRRTHKPKQ